MRLLKALLRDEGIKSKDDLRLYIENNYRKDTKIPFKIMKSIDLNLDDESRIYKDVIEYERVIFDIPYIRIENTTNISFKDCIFTGKVTIGQKVPIMEKIYLDYCLFYGSLKIGGLDNVKEAEFQSIICPELGILNSKFEKIQISHSIIGVFDLADCNIINFETYFNDFSYIDFGNNKLGDVEFDYSQVPIRKQAVFIDEKKLQKIKESIDVFKFRPSLDFEAIAKFEKRYFRNSTFKFLLKNTNIQLDRDAYSHIRYLKNISSQANPFNRLWQIVFGAFVKPFRIIILIFTTIVLFGFIFHLSIFKFNAIGPDNTTVIRFLSWGEAFYYSGISFTTIGYGDITPVGIARTAAVGEGLIGIMLVSAFLVSLTRKYIE